MRWTRGRAQGDGKTSDEDAALASPPLNAGRTSYTPPIKYTSAPVDTVI